MVEIRREKEETVFEIKGVHKVFGFKNELTIPNSHIINAYIDSKEITEWKGIRALGTFIPSLIKAGTFYQDNDSSTIFMDIVNLKNTIIVELKDEVYKKMFIEVDNPEDAIALLNHTLNS